MQIKDIQKQLNQLFLSFKNCLLTNLEANYEVEAIRDFINNLEEDVRPQIINRLKQLLQTKYFFGDTLLSKSCANGDLVSTKFLIENGCNPFLPNEKNISPFDILLKNLRTTKCRVILTYLVDLISLEQIRSGKNPLQSMVQNDIHIPTVEKVLLLESNSIEDQNNNLIDELFDNGEFECSLLYKAVSSQEFQAVKWLLEKGADKFKKQGNGQTPLSFVSEAYYKVIMVISKMNPLAAQSAYLYDPKYRSIVNILSHFLLSNDNPFEVICKNRVRFTPDLFQSIMELYQENCIARGKTVNTEFLLSQEYEARGMLFWYAELCISDNIPVLLKDVEKKGARFYANEQHNKIAKQIVSKVDLFRGAAKALGEKELNTKLEEFIALCAQIPDPVELPYILGARLDSEIWFMLLRQDAYSKDISLDECATKTYSGKRFILIYCEQSLKSDLEYLKKLIALGATLDFVDDDKSPLVAMLFKIEFLILCNLLKNLFFSNSTILNLLKNIRDFQNEINNNRELVDQRHKLNQGINCILNIISEKYPLLVLCEPFSHTSFITDLYKTTKQKNPERNILKNLNEYIFMFNEFSSFSKIWQFYLQNKIYKLTDTKMLYYSLNSSSVTKEWFDNKQKLAAYIVNSDIGKILIANKSHLFAQMIIKKIDSKELHDKSVMQFLTENTVLITGFKAIDDYMQSLFIDFFNKYNKLQTYEDVKEIEKTFIGKLFKEILNQRHSKISRTHEYVIALPLIEQPMLVEKYSLVAVEIFIQTIEQSNCSTEFFAIKQSNVHLQLCKIKDTNDYVNNKLSEFLSGYLAIEKKNYITDQDIELIRGSLFGRLFMNKAEQILKQHQLVSSCGLDKYMLHSKTRLTGLNLIDTVILKKYGIISSNLQRC